MLIQNNASRVSARCGWARRGLTRLGSARGPEQVCKSAHHSAWLCEQWRGLPRRGKARQVMDAWVCGTAHQSMHAGVRRGRAMRCTDRQRKDVWADGNRPTNYAQACAWPGSAGQGLARRCRSKQGHLSKCNCSPNQRLQEARRNFAPTLPSESEREES